MPEGSKLFLVLEGNLAESWPIAIFDNEEDAEEVKDAFDIDRHNCAAVVEMPLNDFIEDHYRETFNLRTENSEEDENGD